MNWRKRVVNKLLPLAEQAARRVCGEVIRVEFDWLNAVFLVQIPESAQVDDKEINAAVQEATGVRACIDTPPSFPFTLHTRRVPGLVKYAPVSSGTLPLSLDLSELDGLRDGYDYLAAIAEDFPYCATFALGGIPMLGYIAWNTMPSLPQTDTEEGLNKYLARRSSAQRKFHVHEGLNWNVDQPSPAAKFHAWLADLPPEAPLLLIDTTFSGGGIDRIAKEVLAAQARPAHVEIHGLLDKSRTPVVLANSDTQNAFGHVKTIFHHVPKLITEDKNELIGYDSLRNMGGLEPIWGATTVEVRDGNDILSIIGTSNVARTIEDLIRSGPQNLTPLDGNFSNASRYMALLTMLKNELSRSLIGLERAKNAGLMDNDTWLKEREAVQKRAAALKMRGRAHIFKK